MLDSFRVFGKKVARKDGVVTFGGKRQGGWYVAFLKKQKD